jgi:PAS domain S-box-containing protein
VIIEKMNERAVILSAAGLIVYCNQRFAEMFEEPMEQLTGSDFLRFIALEEITEYTSLFKKGIQKRFCKELNYTTQQKKTSWFQLSFSALPPQIMGDICVMVMDITELKNNEKKIWDLNTNLEEKIAARTVQYETVNKELEAFSYSVSHDLRAPLRAVNSYAQILIEDYSTVLDDDGKTLLENIRYNARKMGVLIDDLLSFSRLGRKEIDKHKVDMNELINAILIEVNNTIPHHASIRCSRLPVVQADYRLLYQAILNLVANAIKYSSKKEQPLVEIFAEQQNGHTVFAVKDNGAGFNMQFADKLFGVFQRLHSEKEFEGNGVGLAIAQRIITKHGGKLWAEGKENESAIFHFTLN